MTTLERAARAVSEAMASVPAKAMNNAEWIDFERKIARAVLMAVLPTLERYDSDYAGEYKDERGDFVMYADLQAILNDGEGE